MDSKILKNIVTKKAGSWEKPVGGFPEIITSEDGSKSRAEYVELPNGDLMVMEYELDDNVPAPSRVESEAYTPSSSRRDVFTPKARTEEPATPRETARTEEPARTEGTVRTTTGVRGKFDDFSDLEDFEEPYRITQPVRKTSSRPANKNTGKRPTATRPTGNRPANANRRPPARKSGPSIWKILLPVVLLMLVVVAIVILPKRNKEKPEASTEAIATTTEEPTTAEITDIADNPLTNYTQGDMNATPSDALAALEEPDFNPHCVESTKPENLISATYVNVDDVTLDSVGDYKPVNEISFGNGKGYAALDGVFTFRGNNFRNDPAFGYANMTENRLEEVWSHQTGALTSNGTTWSGSGWTGQPLIVKWPKETKQIMNLYDWAKEDDDLVEVIYACLDGNIYFLDLRTGQKTRDTMSVGYTFKGAGALDPRGYPIMYVGSGFHSNQGNSKVFVINLIDCSIMYTFGNGDSFSPRASVSFFDSSALVDAESDTLIYPGENGVLYLIHLNTDYNESAGTLSVNPDRVVKWSYRTHRNGSQYWYGMEDSAVAYKGYLFVMDNGGDFMCLDLNTLQLVWVQDSLDDSNGSPVMSIEDGKLYLYASTSFHLGWRSYNTAPIPIWKIDAETGEIIWQKDYECQSIEDLSGGTQSTIALGQNGLDDYIYVTVSRTGGMNSGVCACISKKDGTVKWEHEASYAWSSPVCVYNEDGSGRVIYCSSAGKMYLLDGITGEQLDALALSEGCIEASPAVYEDFAIVGIRACQIKGVKLK